MAIKFFKKEKIFAKEKTSLNVSLYWKLAVFFVFLATLGAVAFGFYLFMQVNQDFTLEAGSTSGQVDTVKKDRIDHVLDFFTARAKKSDEIIAAPAPVADPSL